MKGLSTMLNRIHPLAAAVAIVISSPAWADVSMQKLDEITVEAIREAELPNANKVEADDLKAKGAATSDVVSLLLDLPGMSAYSAGGVSSLPAIHGMADDRVRIKLDGMDLIASCPNHMNPALSYSAPSQIGSAKVYAGITPVSVGGDSIGGSIVVDSLAPRFAADGQGTITTGEVGAYYRSNGNATGVNVTLAAITERVNLTYTGSTAESDNYTAGGDFRTYTASGVQGHDIPLDEVASSAYKTRNHQLALAYRFDNHLLEAKLGYQDMPYQYYPNQRMDMLDNEATRFNVRYQGQFDGLVLDPRAYHEEVDHFMDFGPDKRYWYGTESGGPSVPYGSPCAPISPTCATGMPMYTASETDGANIKADWMLSDRDLLRLGAEIQTYAIDDWWPPSGGMMWPGVFWNVNNGRRDRTAVFGEWESKPSDTWTTLLGLRFERVSMDADDVRGYDIDAAPPGSFMMTNAEATAFNAADRARDDNNLDLTALARYHASDALDVEFGLARKVRSPNVYERYSWSTWTMAAVMNNFVGDGNGYVGNLDLDPEVAHTISATFDWHANDRAWELKATPYYTRVTDFIDAARVTNNSNQFNVLRYINQDARLFGMDLSGKLELGETALGKLALKTVVNYTDGTNLDTDDALYNIMPLNGRIGLTQQIGRWDNEIEWVGVNAKDDTSDARNEIKTKGYGLINLRASYVVDRFRLDLGIDNVFDRNYDLPLGGAYVAQGTTMSINAIPWGIAVPGMGRSIYAGVNISF
jgi:iron complex outermembrane recepter protein